MLKLIAGLFLIGALYGVAHLVLLSFEKYPEISLWACATPIILFVAYLVGDMVVPGKRAKSEEEITYDRG